MIEVNLHVKMTKFLQMTDKLDFPSRGVSKLKDNVRHLQRKSDSFHSFCSGRINQYFSSLAGVTSRFKKEKKSDYIGNQSESIIVCFSEIRIHKKTSIISQTMQIFLGQSGS